MAELRSFVYGSGCNVLSAPRCDDPVGDLCVTTRCGRLGSTSGPAFAERFFYGPG